jgi:hypothetical protein
VKAISVRAPWWWYILHGGKDIENRDWLTHFRGRVLLHAGKAWVRANIAYDYEAALGMGGPAIGREEWQRIRAACGCIVGSVEIADCVGESRSRWFVGDYGFVLRNPIAFRTPIPYRGALQFFDVPDVLVNQVREMRESAPLGARA